MIIWSSATLPCNTFNKNGFFIRARGSPQPSITWLKDGHAMVDPRFDIRPDGSLVVQNVTNNDEGTFLCVADNGNSLRTYNQTCYHPMYISICQVLNECRQEQNLLFVDPSVIRALMQT